MVLQLRFIYASTMILSRLISGVQKCQSNGVACQVQCSFYVIHFPVSSDFPVLKPTGLGLHLAVSHFQPLPQFGYQIQKIGSNMSISCGSKTVNLSTFVTYHCSALNYNFGFKFQKVHLSTKNFTWKWTRVGSNWYPSLCSCNGGRCVKTFRAQGRSPGLFSIFGGDCGMPYLC